MTSPNRPVPPTVRSTSPAAGRKPYKTPVIEAYGTIPALTRSFSASGKVKDGGPNSTKS
jgi:hypothetical protein